MSRRLVAPTHAQWEVLLALATPGQVLVAVTLATGVVRHHLAATTARYARPVTAPTFAGLRQRRWLAVLGRQPRQPAADGQQVLSYRLSVAGRRLVARLHPGGTVPTPN